MTSISATSIFLASHSPPLAQPSHLSPLTPHASQLSPLTSESHRSPITLASHSHIRFTMTLNLPSDSQTHTNFYAASNSKTNSHSCLDPRGNNHGRLVMQTSRKHKNMSCEARSTEKLTKSAVFYV